MVQMQNSQQILPAFLSRTRMRTRDLDVKTWSSGNRITHELPQTGYLSAIYLEVEGTMNCGGGSALADLGPWNLLRKIALVMNQGNAEIIRISGYSAAMLQALDERGASPHKAGIGDTTPHVDLYAAPVASGNNTWKLSYKIPIAMNQHWDADLGLLNLQSPELRCTLEIECGTAADAVTVVGTGFTGSIYISYDYYDVPPIGAARYPPKTVVRTLEESIPILAVGDVRYQIVRQGVLTQLLQVVRCNGARSDAIDQFEIVMGETDTLERIRRSRHRDRTHRNHAINFPVGVYLYDWLHTLQLSSAGGLRNAIDTQKFSEIDFVTRITSGTTLGSGNNEIIFMRRIIQVYG